MSTAATPVIDADHAAFIEQGLSISLGSCGPDGLPSLVRAIGCRVSDDRRSVTLLVDAIQGAQVLADVRERGAIAVVFSEPATHRTVQLKGSNAIVGAPMPADLDCVAAYRDKFVAALVHLGYPAQLIHSFLQCDQANVAALRFTPTAAFSQTPGPNAGQALLVHA